MFKICPICNGAGKKIVPVVHPHTKQLKTVIDLCLCMRSRIISESPYNKILNDLSEEYIPIEEVDPQLEFNFDNLRECPNILINSTNINTFKIHLKSFLIKHKFGDPIPLIYCANSIDILHNFYVQQNDGTSPHLSDTNKFDLIVIFLGTTEKNEQLKNCVAQIVNTRKSIRKPTWLYLPRISLEACIQEYTPDLAEQVKDYKKVVLKDKRYNVKTFQTKSKEKAESFTL